MSTFTLSPMQAKERLRISLRADVPCFLMGQPSSAKSSIVKQLCEEEELYLIDVRLSQLMPSDLIGLPKVNEYTLEDSSVVQMSTYATLDTFPLECTPIPEGYKGFLIFLDEANQADKYTQGAMYKLVLDRMVHTRKLHPSTRIVLAGNRMSDMAVANKISSALKTRMTWINLEINPKEFISYVEDQVAKDIWNPIVLGFLNFRPDLINNFDPKKETETYASPRSYEMLSKELNAGLLDTGSTIYRAAIVGTIGESAGIDFCAFLDVMNSLPSIQQIESDPLNTVLPDENGAKYALGAYLANKVNKSNIDKVVDYLERIDEKDLLVLAYRMILPKYPMIAQNKKVLNTLGAIRHKLSNSNP